jgi:hypothetical protein
MNEQQVIRTAKADAWAKAHGGFVVAEMSNGALDWFPTGQTPNIDGKPDRGARVVRRFRWAGGQWKEIG